MNDLEKMIFILTIIVLMLGSFLAGTYYERNNARSLHEQRLEKSRSLYNKKIQSYLPPSYSIHKTVNYNLIHKFQG